MRRERSWLPAVCLLGILLLSACASDPSRGTKVLEAVVVGRHHDQPGTGGASFHGTGNYYLIFEAQEGTATATYRFLVTESQYRRFEEGTRVRIVITNHELRDVRPLL